MNNYDKYLIQMIIIFLNIHVYNSESCLRKEWLNTNKIIQWHMSLQQHVLGRNISLFSVYYQPKFCFGTVLTKIILFALHVCSLLCERIYWAAA
jgi:hypothetical protein